MTPTEKEQVRQCQFCEQPVPDAEMGTHVCANGLKTCPFCGAVPEFEATTNENHAWVRCSTPLCLARFAGTLIPEWNRRAESPELDRLRRENEELKKQHERLQASNAAHNIEWVKLREAKFIDLLGWYTHDATASTTLSILDVAYAFLTRKASDGNGL